MYSTGHVSFSVRIYVLLLYVKILLYIMYGYNLPWLSSISYNLYLDSLNYYNLRVYHINEYHLHMYPACGCTSPARVPHLHVDHLHLYNLHMCHLKAYHLNIYNLHVIHLNTITLKQYITQGSGLPCAPPTSCTI
jgi:hypothetical protein